MKKPITVPGEFETPAQLVDAMLAARARRLAEEAEERIAEEAARSDPGVQAWVEAANAEAYAALLADELVTPTA